MGSRYELRRQLGQAITARPQHNGARTLRLKGLTSWVGFDTRMQRLVFIKHVDRFADPEIGAAHEAL